MTIMTNKGTELTIKTRTAGNKILASLFSPLTGNTPMWQETFAAGTADSEIERAAREYLVDNTSLLD